MLAGLAQHAGHNKRFLESVDVPKIKTNSIPKLGTKTEKIGSKMLVDDLNKNQQKSLDLFDFLGILGL